MTSTHGENTWSALIERDSTELLASLPGAWGTASRVTVERPGDQPVAASAFDVDRLLAGTAAFATSALADLDGSLVTQRRIDMEHLLAWTTSTVLVDGHPIPSWADLSGVYETGDGRLLQLHCNFPHHAAGVIEHLGVEHANDEHVTAAVTEAIAQRDGAQLEAALIERGMIAALVRTIDEWDAHPHAVATRDLPLITIERIGDADPRPPISAADLRVLDTTRVLAGPVAGHLFASAGADVLRVGAAHLPSVDVGVLSTGFGKRNAFVDLRTDVGRSTMLDLLGGADVWLDAYRPGAIADLGVDAHRAADARPGIVIVQLSAFDAAPDTDGPWAGRRGFDSIVQSTTGVRWAGGVATLDADANANADANDAAAARPAPRGLPVQALDHATGFLAAGVAARLAAHQRVAGGSWLARLSLLRTRHRLVSLGGPRPYTPAAPRVDDRFLASVTAPAGEVTAVRPFAGRWTSAPMPLGHHRPAWR